MVHSACKLMAIVQDLRNKTLSIGLGFQKSPKVEGRGDFWTFVCAKRVFIFRPTDYTKNAWGKSTILGINYRGLMQYRMLELGLLHACKPLRKICLPTSVRYPGCNDLISLSRWCWTFYVLGSIHWTWVLPFVKFPQMLRMLSIFLSYAVQISLMNSLNWLGTEEIWLSSRASQKIWLSEWL